MEKNWLQMENGNVRRKIHYCYFQWMNTSYSSKIIVIFLRNKTVNKSQYCDIQFICFISIHLSYDIEIYFIFLYHFDVTSHPFHFLLYYFIFNSKWFFIRFRIIFYQFLEIEHCELMSQITTRLFSCNYLTVSSYSCYKIWQNT